MNLRGWLFGSSSSPVKTSAPANDKQESDNADSDSDEFVIIQNYPPYSKQLGRLEYNKDDPGLRNSSHRVIPSRDSLTKEVYFLKYCDNATMLHVEAFLNHVYSLSLLYGVARCYVRYNQDCKPVALSSKQIGNFRTFKDENLTKKHLNSSSFRHRFLKILAIMKRMHEDDSHKGNFTIDLKIFDTDCAFWDATYRIKGGRPGVDNLLPGNILTGKSINRNPETSFILHEDEVINFPAVTHSNTWYHPSVDCPMSMRFSNNPFTPEETQLVRELKHDPESLMIFFQEALDWMLDLSARFEHLARLHFPDNLTVQDENVIELYSRKNRQIDQEYWDILPKMVAFKDFLRHSWGDALQEIIVRSFIRNARMDKDKAAYPTWEKLIAAAKVDPMSIIEKYNLLIEAINDSQILAFSCTMKNSSLVNQSAFFAQSIMVSNSTCILDKICLPIAEQLISRSASIARELIAKEETIGTECWDAFLLETEIKSLPETGIKSAINMLP